MKFLLLSLSSIAVSQAVSVHSVPGHVDVPTAVGVLGGIWFVWQLFRPFIQRLADRLPSPYGGNGNGRPPITIDCPRDSEAMKMQQARLIELQEKTVDMLGSINTHLQVAAGEQARTTSGVNELLRR